MDQPHRTRRLPGDLGHAQGPTLKIRLGGSGLLARRPFRAPHHTISAAALIGGGASPQPGEASLAHHGVLFLDELTEFRRDVLEALRQPLEDREVTVARAQSTLSYPASFQLVAAANPCPCGYLGDDRRDCSCTPMAVQRYRARLSGPLLDRLDLQVAVPAVPWRQLSAHRRGEASASVAARVAAARVRQAARFAGLGLRNNGEMGPEEIRRWARPDGDGRRLLEHASRGLGLSARAYHRILRVARSIADLDGAHRIVTQHLSEAMGYRNLDVSVFKVDNRIQPFTSHIFRKKVKKSVFGNKFIPVI